MGVFFVRIFFPRKGFVLRGYFFLREYFFKVLHFSQGCSFYFFQSVLCFYLFYRKDFFLRDFFSRIFLRYLFSMDFFSFQGGEVTCICSEGDRSAKTSLVLSPKSRRGNFISRSRTNSGEGRNPFDCVPTEPEIALPPANGRSAIFQTSPHRHTFILNVAYPTFGHQNGVEWQRCKAYN